MAFCTPLGCSHQLSHLYGNPIPAAGHLKYAPEEHPAPSHPTQTNWCPARLLSLEPLWCSIILKHSWTLWCHFFWSQKQLWGVSLSSAPWSAPVPPWHRHNWSKPSTWAACKSLNPHWRKNSTLSFNSWICSFPNDSDFKSEQFLLCSALNSHLTELPVMSLPLHHCLSQSPNSWQLLCLTMPRQSLLYIQPLRLLWLFPAAIQPHRNCSVAFSTLKLPLLSWVCVLPTAGARKSALHHNTDMQDSPEKYNKESNLGCDHNEKAAEA